VDNYTIYILLFSNLVFLVYCFLILGEIAKLKTKIKNIETNKKHSSYKDQFNIFYYVMVQMFENKLVEPKIEYIGFRGKLIEMLFYQLIPEAEGKIKVRHDLIEDDVYYDGTDTAKTNVKENLQ
jgi:hypothetical protein